jgi:hypothetical protein
MANEEKAKKEPKLDKKALDAVVRKVLAYKPGAWANRRSVVGK